MLMVDDPIRSAIRTIIFLKGALEMKETLDENDARDISTVVQKLREFQQKRQ
jgi:hypothetical protein